MKRIFAAIGLLALSTVTPVFALSPEELVGTWKVLSSVRQMVGSDKVENNLGANLNGVMIITPDHRFIILYAAEARKPAKTTEEFAALQKSEIAYSGLATFEPDPNNPQGLKMTNKVDVAWNVVWTGTTQVRFLSLSGGKLTIRTPPIKNPFSGEMAIATLTFERAK